ncbi:hypothetical protein AMATHDRAFT_64682, partial [Amanita thiersii Skay4041]
MAGHVMDQIFTAPGRRRIKIDSASLMITARQRHIQKHHRRDKVDLEPEHRDVRALRPSFKGQHLIKIIHKQF